MDCKSVGASQDTEILRLLFNKRLSQKLAWIMILVPTDMKLKLLISILNLFTRRRNVLLIITQYYGKIYSRTIRISP